MTRTEIYKSIRAGMRDYHRSKPPHFKYSLSQWLLKMRGVQENAFLTCDWPGGELLEAYFIRLLGLAALCMEEGGVITPGIGPPLERRINLDDMTLDHVFLAIDRGCCCLTPGTPSDYVIRISCCLQQAFTAMATVGGDPYALDAVRDIASFASLGIVNKTYGE